MLREIRKGTTARAEAECKSRTGLQKSLQRSGVGALRMCIANRGKPSSHEHASGNQAQTADEETWINPDR